MSNYKNIFQLLILLIIALHMILSCKEDSNNSSKVVDNQEYEEKLYFEDYESPNEKWGYLDTLGQMVIPAKFDHAREFSEGLAAVNFEGKWGYIDPQGTWLIPPRFRAAYSFKNGIARIQLLNKKYGFIGKNGEFALPPLYDEIYDFCSGFARLVTGPVQHFINMEGDTLNKIGFQQANDFKNGWARVKEVFYGFIDTSGEKIIDTHYEKLFYPASDMIRFRLKGKYGFLSKSGKLLIPPTYEFATDFQQDVAMVRKNGLSYLITKQVNPILIENKDAISTAGSNLWKVKDHNTYWCILNSSAELLSSCNYTVINNFYDGMAAYQRDGYWGFMNLDGEEVVPPIFPLVWDFKEGKARVIYRNGVGYIDKRGEMIIPAYYFENRDFSEGLARVQVF